MLRQLHIILRELRNLCANLLLALDFSPFHQNLAVAYDGVDTVGMGRINEVRKEIDIWGERVVVDADQRQIRKCARLYLSAVEPECLVPVLTGAAHKLVKPDCTRILPPCLLDKSGRLHGLQHIEIV